MRAFSLVQISDLHIDRSGTQSLDVLAVAVKDALKSLAKPSILVVSGDLVDSPSTKTLGLAKDFLTELASSFHDCFLVPGNHDVKQYLGNFLRTEEFASFFPPRPSLLIREAGLHLIGVDSTPASWAQGSVSSLEYDKMVVASYDGEALPNDERNGLARVAVLHHHPLPLADAEDGKVLGIRDEGFTYLQSPARFLHACMNCGVCLILHGHQHVSGIARYSIQSEEPVEIYTEAQWRDLYVLSCPSSTGKSGEPGFNTISFHLGDSGNFIDVVRYVRRFRRGKFERKDKNRPNGTIRLHLNRSVERDVAVDIAAKLAAMPVDEFPKREFYDHVAQLFVRRAFYFERERHWGLLLYALIRTRLTWEQEVLPRLKRSQREIGY